MKPAGLTYVALGILQRGLSLLLLPFVTRAMAVEEYGAVSVVVALGAFATAVFGAPLQAAVTRWSSKTDLSRADRNSLAAARGWLAFAAPATLIGAAAAPLIVHDKILGVDGYLISGEILAAAIGLHLSYFTLPNLRGKEKLRAYVLVSVCYIATSLLAKIFLVLVLKLGADGWVASDVVAAAIGYALSMTVSRTARVTLQQRHHRELFAFCGPLVIQSMTTWSMQSLSRPLAAALMPLTQVGIYAACLNAIGAAMILVFEFNKSSAVSFSRGSSTKITSAIKDAIRAQRLLGLAIALTTTIAAPIFVTLILPPEYDSASTVLIILAPASFLVALYDLPMNFLVYAEGNTRHAWIPTTLAAVMQVVGLLVLGPQLGAVGAGISTLSAYVMMTLGAFALLHLTGFRVSWRRLGIGIPDLLLAFMILIPVASGLILNVEPLVTATTTFIAFILLAVLIVRDKRLHREG